MDLYIKFAEALRAVVYLPPFPKKDVKGHLRVNNRNFSDAELRSLLLLIYCLI